MALRLSCFDLAQPLVHFPKVPVCRFEPWCSPSVWLDALITESLWKPWCPSNSLQMDEMRLIEEKNVTLIVCVFIEYFTVLMLMFYT